MTAHTHFAHILHRLQASTGASVARTLIHLRVSGEDCGCKHVPCTNSTSFGSQRRGFCCTSALCTHSIPIAREWRILWLQARPHFTSFASQQRSFCCFLVPIESIIFCPKICFGFLAAEKTGFLRIPDRLTECTYQIKPKAHLGCCFCCHCRCLFL